MSVWIFLAVETRELPCGESETHLPPDFFGIEEENLGSDLFKAMKPSL